MIIKTSPENAKRLFPDYDKRFALNDSHIAYVLIKNNIPVSVLCISMRNNTAKFHACFTPIVFRRKGHFKELLNGVVSEYSNMTLYADCLSESVGVFMQCGFKMQKKKYNKGWTLYIMRRELDEHEICN